jgi:hypothetical protein
MADLAHPEGSIQTVAARLAELLTGAGSGLADPGGSDLVFEPSLSVRSLPQGLGSPPEVWAVDGGQALVADAKCLQVYVTRAARVCWTNGRSVLEEDLPLRAFLLGLGEDRRALAALNAPVHRDASVDVNLLREWAEWSAAASCVASARPGAMVLIDGDLEPDWRIAPEWLAGLLDTAADRKVTLLGVTKHTGLSWGGAPLLGVLERMATEQLGPRERWWAPVARTNPSAGPGVLVVVARLDPDARFAFRVDLPGDADAETSLTQLCAVCDDASFPGYPYPLSVADRLAACPSWVRDEVWSLIDEEFDQAGVPLDLRERAFTDRHRLMERY